jgi:Tol biopolymer transport system component/DNA-binding winged helix-turn-helix (wHTH) protein
MNMQGPNLLPVIRFDVFELDLRAGVLRRKGRPVKLQEQPFRILALIAGRAGDVVAREELRQLLWPADTFVDFDHGLNSAVARLRDALKDSAGKPRFIETVAKKGYRFIGNLDPSQPRELPPAATEMRTRDVVVADRLPGKISIGALAVSVLLCAIGLLAFYRNGENARASSSIEVAPLVSLHGFQVTPASSPDGRLVAFRESDGLHHNGIYTAMAGGEKSLQLTANPGDCCPTWSPDGREIAFSRYSDKTFSIFVIPALGGTEHRVYRGPASIGGGLSWSADGKFLAFPEASESDPTTSWLSLLSLADGSLRRLTTPPPASMDSQPSFSPDGSQLAFDRATIAGVSNDIYVIPRSGGKAVRLTFDHLPIMGVPAWTADGKEIVFSSTRGGRDSLWRISASGGIPRPVAGPIGEGTWPSIPSRGDELVYEQEIAKLDIWRVDLKDARHLQKAPVSLVSEKGNKMRPELSPDGRKIAFESDRLGHWDIWTCSTDGSGCEQVTNLEGTAGRARWSPNARYIAFEFHPGERSEIYLVEVPGGVPHLLPTIPGADNLTPSWSRDGQWLYFASKRGYEPFQIWKISIAGRTPPVEVTKNGGLSPVESPDGRFLYYAKYEAGGIWRMPLAGGEETRVLEESGGPGWPNWALTDRGIYFLRTNKPGRDTVQFLDFAAQRIIPIFSLDKGAGWGLSMSRDAKSIVYVQSEFAEANLMLVKNFR